MAAHGEKDNIGVLKRTKLIIRQVISFLWRLFPFSHHVGNWILDENHPEPFSKQVENCHQIHFSPNYFIPLCLSAPPVLSLEFRRTVIIISRIWINLHQNERWRAESKWEISDSQMRNPIFKYSIVQDSNFLVLDLDWFSFLAHLNLVRFYFLRIRL